MSPVFRALPQDYFVVDPLRHGLAIDQTGYEALVETARLSERSAFERGDNVIFLGPVGNKIRNLSIDEADIFPVVGEPVRYPVEF